MHKNIERHTAHTIVSWPNPKQRVIVKTSDLMMIISQSIYILSIITKEIGKLKTHSPIYCIMDNWENMRNLTRTLTYRICEITFILPMKYSSNVTVMVKILVMNRCEATRKGSMHAMRAYIYIYIYMLAHSSLGDWKDLFITHLIIIIKSEVSTFPLLSYFYVVVCLRWLYYHILSSITYISREH